MARIDDTKRTETFKAAQGIAEGFYHIAGGSVEMEHALDGLWFALSMTSSEDDDNRRLGYILALDTLRCQPDALVQGLRLLRDELLNQDPKLMQALRTLHEDLKEEHTPPA